MKWKQQPLYLLIKHTAKTEAQTRAMLQIPPPSLSLHRISLETHRTYSQGIHECGICLTIYDHYHHHTHHHLQEILVALLREKKSILSVDIMCKECNTNKWVNTLYKGSPTNITSNKNQPNGENALGKQVNNGGHV